MSDIKVGDLVIVLRGSPCVCVGGTGGSIGRIFRVADLRMSEGRYCVHCNAQKPDTLVAVPENDDFLIYSLPRLKRIPPLDELEGEKLREEITA